MVAGAERHLWVDKDAVFRCGHVLVEGAGNDATAVDDEWLKIILLPFFVPVFVLRLGHGVGNFHVGQWEGGQDFVERLTAEQTLLHVATEMVLTCLFGQHGYFRIGGTLNGGTVELVGVNKAVETYFGQHGGQHVLHGFRSWTCGKSKFEIFHGETEKKNLWLKHYQEEKKFTHRKQHARKQPLSTWKAPS